MSMPQSAGGTRRSTTRGPSWRRLPAPYLMQVARDAAGRGHHVFPLWPRSKTPLLHGKRRCTRAGVCKDGHLGWEQRATLDPDLIRYWWTAAPTGNVGIACGPSGLYVIDLDSAQGKQFPGEWAGVEHGRAVLARLAEQAGQPFPDDTYQVRTPSSPVPGEHLYYEVDDACQLRSTAGRAGPLIDSRGHGGFIVAAGSKRPGGVYAVTRRAPIAPLPGWLVPQFSRPARLESEPVVFGDVESLSDARLQRYLDTVTANVVTAAPKTAHDTLVRAAYTLGRLVAGGDFTDDEARSALHIAAQDRRIPSREADEAITDGMAAGGLHGRRLGDRAA